MKALQECRGGKVKALVYRLTHSFSGRAAAILRVVSNSGARTPGVDQDRWNTLEAKTAAFHTLTRRGYRAQPLRRVHIPKSHGKKRPLEILAVADRVAQMVVKMHREPIVEPCFHDDSYRYRPGKSALDAVVTARQRCGRSDWVIDLDIKGFLDSAC